MGKKSTTISIPVELYEEITRLLKRHRLGYFGVAEYIREAVRLKLQEDKERLRKKG